MTDRYCRECGTPVDPGNRFCTECGNEMEVGTQYETETGTGASSTQYGTDQRGTQSGSEWEETQHGTDRGDVYGTDRGDTYGTDRGDVYGAGSRYQQQSNNTGLAALTHVITLFAGLIGPLILYFVADDPFVKENAANATNWQIMLIVYMFLSIALVFMGVAFTPAAFLFILVPLALGLADLAFIVIAAIKASNGEAWSYPLTPKIL